MKYFLNSLFLIGVALVFFNCSSTFEKQEIPLPNILFIIVDDLGFADLGCYGSEIDTENIDALAKEGILFTNFYASPNCSPTRSMIMSGMDNHQAGIGAMAMLTGPNQKGKSGYEGYLNNNTIAFSELLQDQGYRTYYSGKWHLGNNKISNPNARGFDKAWWQVGGAPKSHFDLSSGGKLNYFENDKPQEQTSESFFSTSFLTDKLIAYIDLEKKSKQPFLGVLSFSAVHFPIQCPENHIDLYDGKYEKGYEELRKSRLAAQKEKRIISNNIKLSNLPPQIKPWEKLTKEEKLSQSRRMEVYAGMVKHMDDNVGKFFSYLKKNNQYKNTLVILMSDNGGAGFDGYQSKRGQKKYAQANNEIENTGKEGSLNFIGAGWGSATSTPFRLFKRHISEGGLRVPMIVSGGYLKSNLKSKFKNDLINHQIFTVRDIAPTIQEMVGIEYPADKYKGRNILPQTGKSFVKVLLEKPTEGIHDKDEIFGWELFKRKAVQKNGWKILWIEPPFGTGAWELFNLKEDPTERNNLAKIHPEKLKEMIAAWEKYKLENNVIISNGELLFP